MHRSKACTLIVQYTMYNIYITYDIPACIYQVYYTSYIVHHSCYAVHIQSYKPSKFTCNKSILDVSKSIKIDTCPAIEP